MYTAAPGLPKEALAEIAHRTSSEGESYGMRDLPVELLAKALGFSPPPSLAIAGTCCRRFRAAATDAPAAGGWNSLVWSSSWGLSPKAVLRLIARQCQELPSITVVLDGCPTVTTSDTLELLAAVPSARVSAVGCERVRWQPRWSRCDASLQVIPHVPVTPKELQDPPSDSAFDDVEVARLVAVSFGGRLQRLPASLIGVWRCKRHYGIAPGTVHRYGPCGSFDHDGMLHRFGFVHSIRRHESAVLAEAGWMQLVLVYRPGGHSSEYDRAAPDIAAPILVRDSGPLRYVCHRLSVLDVPLSVNDDDADEEAQHEFNRAMKGLLPSGVPEAVGVFGDHADAVVLGVWVRVGDLVDCDAVANT